MRRSGPGKPHSPATWDVCKRDLDQAIDEHLFSGPRSQRNPIATFDGFSILFQESTDPEDDVQLRTIARRVSNRHRLPVCRPSRWQVLALIGSEPSFGLNLGTVITEVRDIDIGLVANK